MKDSIRYIKTTGIYLIGNVLTKVISFFLLPIYTRYLPPADYGTYDLNIAYITFLSSILFLDIWGGIMRFMFDYKKAEEKAYAVKAGMVIFSCSTLIYAIAVIILGNLLGIDYKFWLFMYGLLTNIQQVFGFVARGYGQNRVFAFGGVLGSFVTIICNIIFIVGMKGGYQYLYISSCIGLLVNIIILERSVHFFALMRSCGLNKTLLKEMTIYSLPLSINSAAFWFLSSFNKVLISYKLTTVENGFYAVANRFSSVITLFTQCFQMAWQELTFSKAGSTKKEMEQFYTHATNEYISFMSLGIMLVIPCIKVLFPYLIDSAYSRAEGMVPLAILATLFSCISSFMASIISTLKKNKYIFTTTVTGSIVNVILAFLLMDYLGVEAANVSILFGYFMISVRRYQLIKKYINIKLNIKKCLFLCFQTSCICIIYWKATDIINGLVIIYVCCLFIVMYKEKIKAILGKV